MRRAINIKSKKQKLWSSTFESEKSEKKFLLKQKFLNVSTEVV